MAIIEEIEFLDVSKGKNNLLMTILNSRQSTQEYYDDHT